MSHNNNSKGQPCSKTNKECMGIWPSNLLLWATPMSTVLLLTSRVTRLRRGYIELCIFSRQFPTMLPPHRTTNPATQGFWPSGMAYWDRHSILQSGQPLGHISQAWVFDHINPSKCPLGSRGGNYFLAFVHSQMNPHMCAIFGANRSSRLADFPHFQFIPPPKPPKFPLGDTGQIFI